jgi:hypothetical protein
VDAGWIPYFHQAGMKGSDLIVAINSDPNAPIFDIAHLGIVDDLFQVIPELVKLIERRGGAGEGARSRRRRNARWRIVSAG